MTTDRSNCPAPRHGSASAYSWWKCRCADAREDHRIYNKRRREGRNEPRFVDVTGTSRRLRALVALGYCWRDLAKRLRTAEPRVRAQAWAASPRIHVDSAAKVTALFEELSATPAPEGFAAKKARNTAARNGFLPPLAWGDDIDDPVAVPNLGGDGVDIVDEVAVGEVLAGRLGFKELTELEQIELFRRIDGWGFSQTMDLLRMSAHTVTKWRARARCSDGQVAA